MTALKPIILADFSDLESDEDSDNVPIMAPRSISPMEYKLNLTQSQTLSPVKPSVIADYIGSPDEFHFGIHSMAASISAVKQESNRSYADMDIVDILSDSDSELNFITTEVIDLTLDPNPKRKRRLRKRKRKRKKKKHKKRKKPKKREVIELSESESDDLLEGDETRHAVNLSASSSTSEIKKAVERVCFQNLLFKNRVEFLCQMVKSILREEHETEGKNAESRSPAILIISARRHAAHFITKMIKNFIEALKNNIALVTGGIFAYCLVESDELRHQCKQISRHLPQRAMNIIYTEATNTNESDDMKILQKLSHFAYVAKSKPTIEHLKTLLAHIKIKNENAKSIVFFGTKQAARMVYEKLVIDKFDQDNIGYLDGDSHLCERLQVLDRFRSDAQPPNVLLTTDLIAGSIAHTKAVIINWSHCIGEVQYAMKYYIQRATLSSGDIINIQTDKTIIQKLMKYRIRMKDFHQMMRGAKPPHGHRKRDRERWVYKRRRERERDKRKERARERERSRHRGRRREGGSDYDSDMCEGYEGKHRRRRHTRY
eukprot:821235_1